MRGTKSWLLGWLLVAGWWPVVGWGQGGREVTIAADDTLMVQVLNGEELSREWRVASSGELNLPLVGRVKVAGLTVGECEQLLAERLRRYQHNPRVTVYVQEFRSHPVSVVGGGGQPMGFPPERAGDKEGVLCRSVPRRPRKKNSNGLLAGTKNTTAKWSNKASQVFREMGLSS